MIRDLEKKYQALEQQEINIITELGKCREKKRALGKQIEEYYDTQQELQYWKDRRNE
jgi:hypothetical protein